MAVAKLDARLRRALDRRKSRHGAHSAIRLTDLPEADLGPDSELAAIPRTAGAGRAAANGTAPGDLADDEVPPDFEAAGVVPVEMQGDGPLVVREKFHAAVPMSIDQALFEMEMVGHDFFLFTDERNSMPSVVYRRSGYQYGVIRLVEGPADERGAAGERGAADERGAANGQAGRAGKAADVAGR
jgi:Sigma 54 modulation/S30EA ribosomal protein C terminus